MGLALSTSYNIRPWWLEKCKILIAKVSVKCFKSLTRISSAELYPIMTNLKKNNRWNDQESKMGMDRVTGRFWVHDWPQVKTYFQLRFPCATVTLILLQEGSFTNIAKWMSENPLFTHKICMYYFVLLPLKNHGSHQFYSINTWLASG